MRSKNGREKKSTRRFSALISRQWLFGLCNCVWCLYSVCAHNCIHQFKTERSVKREKSFYFRHKSWSDMHKLGKMQLIWRTRLKLLIWYRYVFRSFFAASVCARAFSVEFPLESERKRLSSHESEMCNGGFCNRLKIISNQNNNKCLMLAKHTYTCVCVCVGIKAASVFLFACCSFIAFVVGAAVYNQHVY